jgi:hypothetical protein
MATAAFLPPRCLTQTVKAAVRQSAAAPMLMESETRRRSVNGGILGWQSLPGNEISAMRAARSGMVNGENQQAGADDPYACVILCSNFGTLPTLRDVAGTT